MQLINKGILVFSCFLTTSCHDISYEKRSRYTREVSKLYSNYNIYSNCNQCNYCNQHNHNLNNQHDYYAQASEKKYFNNGSRYNQNTIKKYTGYYKIGNPYSINGRTYYPREYDSYSEIGQASWYGSDFHNKKTSNGEIYNMNDMTGAHQTLPLPSIVRVTNLENGSSVKIRINDRGPFVENRILDVSKAAAEKLGFKDRGIITVKVELLKEETEEFLERNGLKKM